jgi:OFA family oxalate/formate antiporter-like MFS transporter
MIRSGGYGLTYLWFGLGQGIVVAGALLLRAPRQTEDTALVPALTNQGKHYAFGELVRSPAFWLMYAMFVLVGAGGLMLQAQLGPIAADLTFDKVPVSILGLTMLTPVFAVSLSQVTNGLRGRSSAGCPTGLVESNNVSRLLVRNLRIFGYDLFCG